MRYRANHRAINRLHHLKRFHIHILQRIIRWRLAARGHDNAVAIRGLHKDGCRGG
jgi:hypothetical protein